MFVAEKVLLLLVISLTDKHFKKFITAINNIGKTYITILQWQGDALSGI